MSERLEVGRDPRAVIALDLDGASLHGAAGAAAALKIPQQRLLSGGMGGDVFHLSHRLAAAAALVQSNDNGSVVHARIFSHSLRNAKPSPIFLE